MVRLEFTHLCALLIFEVIQVRDKTAALGVFVKVTLSVMSSDYYLTIFVASGEHLLCLVEIHVLKLIEDNDLVLQITATLKDMRGHSDIAITGLHAKRVRTNYRPFGININGLKGIVIRREILLNLFIGSAGKVTGFGFLYRCNHDYDSIVSSIFDQQICCSHRYKRFAGTRFGVAKHDVYIGIPNGISKLLLFFIECQSVEKMIPEGVRCMFSSVSDFTFRHTISPPSFFVISANICSSGIGSRF